MTNVIEISRARRRTKACVVALHCSLGSGRQWKALADELGRSHRFFAPDISGYGANGCALDLPLTLAEEIRAIRGTLNDAEGPIHLVGHSYGGAIAFKIATRSPFAHRLRSLTLIEPVLPTLLLRQRRGPAAARALRAGRARRFRGHLERIGAGGDRQVHARSGTAPARRIRCRRARGCA